MFGKIGIKELETIIHALEQCDGVCEELSPAEHNQIVRKWLAAYGGFYNEDRRRLRGSRAIAEAQKMNDGNFLVVPCRNPSSKKWSPVGTAYRCRSNELPDLTEASHYADIFLSPEDLSWTLLFGHEVDVFGGPDFSYLDWRVSPSVERARKRE